MVSKECELLEKGKPAQSLLGEPLWPQRPDWFNRRWPKAAAWLSRTEHGFEIWREWYYGRLEGLPHAFKGFTDKADVAFYQWLIERDNEWWGREDIAAINAEIAAKVDELRELPEQTDPKVDFFISYASEDEAAAREVADVLDDLGKSYIVQYRDFPQQNWVNAMDDAMARSDRLIPLYSRHYISSDHCKTEWNHFYKMDPSAAQRRIVAFRLDGADLMPIMDQVVYKDMVAIPRAERARVIRDWIGWEPPALTQENVAKTVTTHLDPGVVEGGDGKLDITPDPVINDPEVPAELARAMDEVRMMLDLVRRSQRNLSSMMQGTLILYDDHFTERGKDSSWGGLDRYMAIIIDGLPAMSSAELGDEKAALGQLIAAHKACMAALRNVDEQMRELANVPLPHADQTAIADLVEKLKNMAALAKDLEVTSGQYDAAAQELVDLGRDFAFEAGAPDADEKPSTARHRFLRYVGGFGIATLTVLGSIASIRMAPEAQPLLLAGRELVEAFFRMVGV
ncbi:TIR domain-containing protein [uncultured Erythrobacter sp.]|uniref:toll/interleukin-1 receptor domain-containing protein n=1 Tax=uncultured Erythrobacter sp. TaxID=263913 RepID=UPI002615AA8B|nr:TIR domain-containing protein [uncultured Erythrobacter sp.]